MAHYLIFPKKDAWIYSKAPAYNYGLDEILEIKLEPTGSRKNVSRILMQFDLTQFSSASLSASYFYLNLYAANPLNLPADYTLKCHAVSSSWANGTGYPAAYTLNLDGVSWANRTEVLPWIKSGSDYLENISSSQEFSYNEADVRMDVTNIVRQWVSGTITNNGFLIKHSDTEESSSTDYGRLTFYSMDTHTVNLPTLEAARDDSAYVTGALQLIYSGNITGYMTQGTMLGMFESSSGTFIGTTSSLSGSINITTATISGSNMVITGSIYNVISGSAMEPITSDQLSIVMVNLKKHYKYGTNARIRFKAKDLYQRKTFANTVSTSYNIVKYLPRNNSWYSIVDAYTGRIIIPFSDYTKISCDMSGNYFDLNLNGFMPERFYRILFKITLNSADSYFDNDYIFRVVR